MAVSESTVYGGFSMRKCMDKLKEITSPEEWSKDFLFERVAKSYFAIYASIIGKRAGIKGQGVYFDENVCNKVINEGLAINEETLADNYAMKAEDLRKKVVANTIPGQMSFDDTNNLYEEMTLKQLSEIILALEGYQAS